MVVLFFFFFQAEDGIRDVAVTGVQTCALPILSLLRPQSKDVIEIYGCAAAGVKRKQVFDLPYFDQRSVTALEHARGPRPRRSEERRVGKECRSRWSRYH